MQIRTAVLLFNAMIGLGLLVGPVVISVPVVAAQEQQAPPSPPLTSPQMPEVTPERQRLLDEVFRRERELGRSHPDVGVALDALGMYDAEQARYAMATTSYIRAMKIFEEAGPSHERQLVVVLSNYGYALILDQRPGPSIALLERALEIQERLTGPDHLQTAYSLNLLGLAYNDAGFGDKAEAVLLRALEIREGKLGPDHPDVGLSLIHI